ncbi:MAG TPA: glutamate 5-kinase [Polyangiaceae bacterium]|nr:glutamate 5-kinase [Polyangiaceae bacterium]
MADSRLALTQARRLIVKIGSRSLAQDAALTQTIAAQVAGIQDERRRVLIVSSGAIALGLQRLGYTSRPTEMARLQAAASAGQVELMRRWDEAFRVHQLTTAQILLTHADLADRERLNNAREAIAALLETGAVPIINENDTVATDEIRFGDNDQLAAMVAPLVGADLLILLTDVDGVLDPGGARIPEMRAAQDVGAGPAKNGERVGSGGMPSKLSAAEKARHAGAAVVVANGLRPDVLSRIVAGEDEGTFFPRIGEVLRARKHWILFTLRPKGTLLLDAGAAVAIRSGTSSLLPVGVLGLRGQFNPGDSVRLVDPDGLEVGRGLTRLGALDVASAAGKRGPELEMRFGPASRDLVVVHKDDLASVSAAAPGSIPAKKA